MKTVILTDEERRDIGGLLVVEINYHKRLYKTTKDHSYLREVKRLEALQAKFFK